MAKLFGPSSPTSDTPPADDSLPAAPSKLGDPEADVNTTLDLSMEQLKAAGIDDLQPGDRFTVTITATVKSADENGVKADISDASEGEKSTDEPGGDATDEGDAGFQKPKSKIELGPGGMKGLGL